MRKNHIDKEIRDFKFNTLLLVRNFDEEVISAYTQVGLKKWNQ